MGGCGGLSRSTWRSAGGHLGFQAVEDFSFGGGAGHGNVAVEGLGEIERGPCREVGGRPEVPRQEGVVGPAKSIFAGDGLLEPRRIAVVAAVVDGAEEGGPAAVAGVVVGVKDVGAVELDVGRLELGPSALEAGERAGAGDFGRTHALVGGGEDPGAEGLEEDVGFGGGLGEKRADAGGGGAGVGEGFLEKSEGWAAGLVKLREEAGEDGVVEGGRRSSMRKSARKPYLSGKAARPRCTAARTESTKRCRVYSGWLTSVLDSSRRPWRPTMEESTDCRVGCWAMVQEVPATTWLDMACKNAA